MMFDPKTAQRYELIRSGRDLWSERVDTDETGDTLFGYAAMFNSDTLIDSWEGRFTERIMPGAFRNTLNRQKGSVPLLLEHGNGYIGNMPLGKPTVIKEDNRGLYVEAKLSQTDYNENIKALLRDEALDGMSFRFSVKRDEWDETVDPPARTIKEVELHEVSLVTFPAYKATTAGIRAHSPAAYRAWLKANDEIDPTEQVFRDTVAPMGVASWIFHHFDDEPNLTVDIEDTEPTVTIIEEDSGLTPLDPEPVEEREDDTPDDPVHLSDQTPSLSLARMRRQTDYMREYWEMVMANRT